MLTFYFSPNHAINSHQIRNCSSRVKVFNITVAVANLEESNPWSGRSFLDYVTTAVYKTCGNLNVKSEVGSVLVTVILNANRQLVKFLIMGWPAGNRKRAMLDDRL